MRLPRACEIRPSSVRTTEHFARSTRREHLGPHLFNLYINCLLKSLPTESAMAYANDVTLVSHGITSAKAASNMQNL